MVNKKKSWVEEFFWGYCWAIFVVLICIIVLAIDYLSPCTLSKQSCVCEEWECVKIESKGEVEISEGLIIQWEAVNPRTGLCTDYECKSWIPLSFCEKCLDEGFLDE